MKKKLIALMLTIVLCFGLSVNAFAVTGSQTDGPTSTVTTTTGGNTVSVNSSKKATVTKAKNKKNVTLPYSVTIKGVKYPITVIGKKAIGSKTVSITLSSRVKEIKKEAFSNATKIKTIRLKQVAGSKASSYKIAKGAFKGISTKKATLIIGKHMTLKEYKKLAKKFRAAGFKGTIKRQWIRN